MPPPATPAQRRFLPGPTRRQKTPVRPSDTVPRNIDSVLRGDAQDQFNITPRFSTKPSVSKSSSAATATRFAQSEPQATPSRSAGDDVHDKTQSDHGDEDEMLLDTTGEQDWTEDLTLSPKRRRLSGPDLQVQQRPVSTARLFTRPALPAAKSRLSDSSTGLKFRSTPASSQRPAPPSFAPTSSQAQVASYESPLPDAFSPHRRGDGYMPGGLASTMQQWVLETSQVAVQSRKTPKDTYVMKVKVERILLDESKITLIHGQLEDDREVRLALIDSTTSSDRASHSNIMPGTVIGLREPCWPMTTSTDHWIVCVQWRIVPS